MCKKMPDNVWLFYTCEINKIGTEIILLELYYEI